MGHASRLSPAWTLRPYATTMLLVNAAKPSEGFQAGGCSGAMQGEIMCAGALRCNEVIGEQCWRNGCCVLIWSGYTKLQEFLSAWQVLFEGARAVATQ